MQNQWTKSLIASCKKHLKHSPNITMRDKRERSTPLYLILVVYALISAVWIITSSRHLEIIPWEKLLRSRSYNFEYEDEKSLVNTLMNPKNSRISISSHTRAHEFNKEKEHALKTPHFDMHSCDAGNNETLTFPWRTPTFIIIGQHKCGTTALYSILREHPNLLPSTKFEPHYFDFKGKYIEERIKEGPGRKERLCAERYRYATDNFDTDQIMEDPNVMATFEKTPSYFDINDPALIKSVVPDTKIILILRDPVERLQSHLSMTALEGLSIKEMKAGKVNEEKLDKFLNHVYRHKKMALHEKRPQDLRRAPLFRGLYEQRIKKWLKYYELGESMLVLPYEDLRNEPQHVMDEIADFVGFPRYDFQSALMEKDLSPTIRSRDGKLSGRKATTYISDELRADLYDLYTPFNDKLADLLGERFRGIWGPKTNA
mmetsp:Transcript_25747/g.39431  ORF Transcript_25747/g.39431 Transcript_25747/m.39431 type:complete len:430 (+) Transcript_25747:88-1377(+)